MDTIVDAAKAPPRRTKLSVSQKKPCTLVEPFHFLATFAINVQAFCYQSMLVSAACKFNFNRTTCDSMIASNRISREVEERVQMTVAVWSMVANVGFGVCSLVSSRVFGSLTDSAMNKRTSLSIICLGAIFCSVYLTIANRLPANEGAWLLPITLIAFQFVSGSIASSFILLSNANAYLASILPSPANRTLRFSYLQTVYFVALILAPYTSGAMIKHFSRNAALLLSMVCAMLAFGYTAAFLRKAPDNQRHSIKPANKRFSVHPVAGVRVLLVVCCPISIAYSGASSFYYLYVRRRPFSLSDMEAGVFLAAFQLVQGIGLTLLMPFSIKKLSEQTLVFVGLASKALFFVLMAVARNRIMLYSALATTVFLCFDGPAIRSIMTTLVDADEHGRLFGMQSAFQSLGFLISQALLQPLYRASVQTRMPGSVFMVSAAIIVVTMTVIGIFTAKGAFDAPPPQQTKEDLIEHETA